MSGPSVRITVDARAAIRQIRRTRAVMENLSGETWSAPRPLLIDGHEYRRRSRGRARK